MEIKRAGELFYINIIKSINSIDYNRARFIIYDINNTFKIHFKKYIKKKKKYLEYSKSEQFILKII